MCNKQDCDCQLAFQLCFISEKISSSDQIFQGRLLHTWKVGKRKDKQFWNSNHFVLLSIYLTFINRMCVNDWPPLVSTRPTSAWDMEVGCYAVFSFESKLKYDSSEGKWFSNYSGSSDVVRHLCAFMMRQLCFPSGGRRDTIES